MTVTLIERSGVQNPAYRPVALSLLDSMIARLKDITGTLATAFTVACAAAPPATSPAPASVPGAGRTQPVTPVQQQPVPVPQSGAWDFAYAPGTYVYSFRTSATVAPASDTTLKRAVPELDQRATIAISGGGDIRVIDPAPAATAAACDPGAALILRAQQLLPKIPHHLVAGARWRDSTTTTGCRGSIPAESTVISNYVVVGDTTVADASQGVPQGVSLLHIQRTDSLSASGEGAEGQHRIQITATGSGMASLLFDFASGRLVSSEGGQNTIVSVTTSGRLARFVQAVRESVSIAGHP